MEHSEITIRGATFTVCHEAAEAITADDITAIYCDGADDLLKLFAPYSGLIAEFVGETNYQLRMEREADAPDYSEAMLDNRDRAAACLEAF